MPVWVWNGRVDANSIPPPAGRNKRHRVAQRRSCDRGGADQGDDRSAGRCADAGGQLHAVTPWADGRDRSSASHEDLLPLKRENHPNRLTTTILRYGRADMCSNRRRPDSHTWTRRCSFCIRPARRNCEHARKQKKRLSCALASGPFAPLDRLQIAHRVVHVDRRVAGRVDDVVTSDPSLTLGVLIVVAGEACDSLDLDSRKWASGAGRRASSTAQSADNRVRDNLCP